ncbi:hypothetical protein NJC38_12195 [Pseudomonas sp. 21LCFQ010]|uniref:hypothetical protein n=1 Tax=unclassified Pseudomonas TaxID=196821 RepID=UPI0004F77D65|nr:MULTISPECIES: hypothetical protein [unclassified Pseudomonas]MCO8162928.1 hypothetical protein [Pseudomonas sp. 21LCFQ010]BAP43248.1 putative uncharacterized protein [Pseudomonas sp. StFLB209]
MNDLSFSIEWSSPGSGDPVLRATTGQFKLQMADTCLTRNEGIWSRTISDSVLVSAYPLALWLASSWWRLSHETLPEAGVSPSLDWRMSHELGAANHGYVWPRVIVASDGEGVKIWAEQNARQDQSVRYLYGLDAPGVVTLSAFQNCAAGFIESVIGRLDAMGLPDSDLAQLWSYVCQDRDDSAALQRRVLEAQMGYDPEQCPAPTLDEVLWLQQATGPDAMRELAPLIGLHGAQRAKGVRLIQELNSEPGISGRPELPAFTTPVSALPWKKAETAAKQLRAALDNANRPIDDLELYQLLGVSEKQVDRFTVADRQSVSVLKTSVPGSISLIPRKKHPVARRFEYARFIASLYEAAQSRSYWKVSTDLATAQQQFQRAFAAEFLCPVDALVDYLVGNFSESSREQAALHFDVSEKTVEALLLNHGYLENTVIEPKVPYQVRSVHSRDV